MEHLQTFNPAKMYQEYLGSAIAAPWVPELNSYERLRSGERVLDVACGSGFVARQVVQLVAVEGNMMLKTSCKDTVPGTDWSFPWQHISSLDIPNTMD